MNDQEKPVRQKVNHRPARPATRFFPFSGEKHGLGPPAQEPTLIKELMPANLNAPAEIRRREQAGISRRRLYPMSFFYTTYCLTLFGLALLFRHSLVATVFFVTGVGFWTLVEYLSHRYILHGRFSDGKGIVKHFLHARLDPLHWEHHERPWDGLHINGVLTDTLPIFIVCAPLSFVAPISTLPVFLAGVVQGYVAEEWVHHSVHFYDFNNSYFRYIQRHHLYHHSPKGDTLGYGLTNGFWDIVFKTRFPAGVRRALYGRAKKAHSRITS